jgi:hypothetical protein
VDPVIAHLRKLGLDEARIERLSDQDLLAVCDWACRELKRRKYAIHIVALVPPIHDGSGFRV